MLRIVAQSRPAAAKSYYTSQAEYYAAGVDTPAAWGGRGAQLLGLSGAVRAEDFAALCDNLDPRSGDPLTVRTRTGRTVLYDFNVHVPKSLSVLIERTGDPKLMDAVQEAGAAMMAEVEAEMQTRVRKAGQDTDRATGNMVWATIPHRTARPSKVDGRPDPHYHLHITAFNATFDAAERRWKAGQFRDLVRDAPYWQAVFHSSLTARLADLGYGIERTAKGWEVAGVPKAVVAKFSRRTGEIEALAAELGITDPDAKGRLGATSRRAKGAEDLADLRAYWESRLTPGERLALDAVAAGGDEGVVNLRPSAETAVDYAVRHCFERASVVPEKRLVATALEQGVGGVTAAGVRAELGRRGVITREWEGRLVATTREVLAEEQRMLAFARTGRDACRPLAPSHAVHRSWLNAGQQAAVKHVLSSRDRIVLVRGAAGTGKTTMAAEAVEAMQAAGVPVLMLAPSAQASRGVLRGEGFATADTVARFLLDEKYREQARGGVVWVDEASLVGAPTMAKLFDAAHSLDARIVLMGDTRQHAGVERGAALRVLETLGGLPVAEVSEVRRQTGAYKAAVEALSAGRTEEGFGRLEALGAIREIPDEGLRLLALAASYREATAKGESVLVVAPTHAEADRATDAIRVTLKAGGRLGEAREVPRLVPRHLTEAERGEGRHLAAGDVLQFVKHAPGHAAGSRLTVTDDPQALPLDRPDRFQVFRAATLRLAAGDRVRLTANGWTRDKSHRLNNGATYTLAGFTERGDLRLDNGWVVDREFGHLAHGYVGTSHASQGSTVDRVLVAQSATSLPASSAEQFYVSVSRGRKGVEVFTDDRAALRDAVARPTPRLAAVELLGRPPEGRPTRRITVRSIVADRLRRSVLERTRTEAVRDHGSERRRDGAGAGAA